MPWRYNWINCLRFLFLTQKFLDLVHTIMLCAFLICLKKITNHFSKDSFLFYIELFRNDLWMPEWYWIIQMLMVLCSKLYIHWAKIWYRYIKIKQVALYSINKVINISLQRVTDHLVFRLNHLCTVKAFLFESSLM